MNTNSQTKLHNVLIGRKSFNSIFFYRSIKRTSNNCIRKLFSVFRFPSIFTKYFHFLILTCYSAIKKLKCSIYHEDFDSQHSKGDWFVNVQLFSRMVIISITYDCEIVDHKTHTYFKTSSYVRLLQLNIETREKEPNGPSPQFKMVKMPSSVQRIFPSSYFFISMVHRPSYINIEMYKLIITVEWTNLFD